MATTISTKNASNVVIFPEALTNEMFNLVRGKSSLARLSGSAPIPFNGERIFTFNFDNEVSIVAENAAKVNGGGTVDFVSMVPVKVEYGMRVSDEFRFASAEAQLPYLQAFADGFANKVARGLDIMAIHGLNPRTATASTIIGANHFDSKVTNTVTYAAATANDNVTAAIALVESAEHEVTGMAMAPVFRSALAAIKEGSSSNKPLYPELEWGANPDTLKGLSIDTNSTVSFTGTGTGNTNTDRAIVGNFRDYFRWGYARGINIEVIEYGDPDNSGADLKGHNQVYLRGEAYIGWGIIAPEAFARIAA